LYQDNSFDAETAMLLESSADSGKAIDDEIYFSISDNQLNMTPLLVKLPFINSHDGAATFHSQLALGLTQLLIQTSKQITHCKNVVLSGGCFLNQRLTILIKKQLTDQGYKVFCAEQVSPNDSSLSLGQAWVAIEQQALKDFDNNTKEPQGDAVCA
jgi:hydrogenase maturation protein HypF